MPIPITPAPNAGRTAVLALGFRPFFSLAALFGLLSMVLWMLMYSLPIIPAGAGLAPVQWHAHEMVYGYTLAVIAGFLLTAVRNWTGVQTLNGVALGGLAGLWLLARVALLLPGQAALVLAAIADLLFMAVLIFAVTAPVVKVKQWQQVGILSLVGSLLLGNALFYAGALGYLGEGARWGLYAGLYIILALVTVMARRVLPAFIKNGVDENFEPANWPWLDMGGLAAFLAWAVLEVFANGHSLAPWLALGLFGLYLVRLLTWHTRGIWTRPLLWSIYLAYAFLPLGFLLHALAAWGGLSPFLALHAFTTGGLGLMTMGMMARVTLGHTGRNVFAPPAALRPMFALLLASAVVRVLFPLLAGGLYGTWVLVSQVLWILAFALFCWVYLPQLWSPRADGRPG